MQKTLGESGKHLANIADTVLKIAKVKFPNLDLAADKLDKSDKKLKGLRESATAGLKGVGDALGKAVKFTDVWGAKLGGPVLSSMAKLGKGITAMSAGVVGMG